MSRANDVVNTHMLDYLLKGFGNRLPTEVIYIIYWYWQPMVMEKWRRRHVLKNGTLGRVPIKHGNTTSQISILTVARYEFYLRRYMTLSHKPHCFLHMSMHKYHTKKNYIMDLNNHSMRRSTCHISNNNNGLMASPDNEGQLINTLFKKIKGSNYDKWCMGCFYSHAISEVFQEGGGMMVEGNNDSLYCSCDPYDPHRKVIIVDKNVPDDPQETGALFLEGRGAAASYWHGFDDSVFRKYGFHPLP